MKISINPLQFSSFVPAFPGTKPSTSDDFPSAWRSQFAYIIVQFCWSIILLGYSLIYFLAIYIFKIIFLLKWRKKGGGGGGEGRERMRIVWADWCQKLLRNNFIYVVHNKRNLNKKWYLWNIFFFTCFCLIYFIHQNYV